MPFILAPVGSSRMFYPRGEEVAAREAARAGTTYTLSTLSGCRMEDVAKALRSPRLVSAVSARRPRRRARASIARAKAAGFSALVVTIDTPVAGLRERDVRNGSKELLGDSLPMKLRYLPQFFARPRWLMDFLADGGLMKFPNVVVPGQGPMPYTDISRRARADDGDVGRLEVDSRGVGRAGRSSRAC